MNNNEALRWAEKQLRRSTTPMLDAKVLLAWVLKCDQTNLWKQPHQKLTARQILAYTKLVSTRQAGMPVAYLVGEKEFCGLTLKVNRHVLIPRPATEAIVESAITLARRTGAKTIYDIGTGSGAIAIAIANQIPTIKIIASDVSVSALQVARDNIKRHKLTRQIKLVVNKLGTHIKKPALVVANLPYLPKDLKIKTDLKFEPKLALFADDAGLALYKRLFEQTPIDAAIIELGAKQYLPLEKWLNKKHPAAKISPIKDLDGTIVGLQLSR